jgi:hypothetical protein
MNYQPFMMCDISALSRDLNAVGGVCRYWEVEEIVSKGIEGTRYELREEIMLERQLISHKINP